MLRLNLFSFVLTATLSLHLLADPIDNVSFKSIPQKISNGKIISKETLSLPLQKKELKPQEKPLNYFSSFSFLYLEAKQNDME